MEDYLVSTQTLLGVLGHRVLEPYLMRVRSRGAPSTSTIAVESPASTTLTRDEGTNQQLAEIFELRIGGLTARATRTNEGLVVLAGSDVAMNPQPSLSIGYRALREKLTESGSLEASGAKLRVVKDVLFKSPSQAAAVVVGYSINGRDAWRTPDGTTYAAYEQRVSDALLAEIAAPVA